MKQIVLKPVLENGEAVIFKNRVCIVKTSTIAASFIDKKTGQWIGSYDPSMHDIIESPEGQDHIREATKMVEQVADAGKALEDDGRCSCSCADECPLGKIGAEPRCTADELRDAWLKGNQIEEVQPEQTQACKCDGCGQYKNELYLNGFCYACRQSDTQAAAQKPTVAEKEAVGLYYQCTLPYKVYTNVSPGSCGICGKPFKKEPKPEGNPFKVGEKVKAVWCDDSIPCSCQITGKIEQIQDDCLCVHNGLTFIWVHYKQCERVE